MDERWRIQLFGGLCASRGDRVVRRFRSQKTGALLAYLAYHYGRTHPRQVLIELLWPGCDPDLGRDSLSTALGSLRRQLELPGDAALFRADRFTVGLNADRVTTDVAEFQSRLESRSAARTPSSQINSLAEAVELYAGPLLPGYYGSWIPSEQQRLDELFFRTIRQMITHFEQAGDLERALECARRAVSVDPLREEAHREVIRLHAAAGQPGAALRQYRELERLLKQEFDASPGAATRVLIDSLGRPASPSVRRVPDSHPAGQSD